jgi:hypothetical protein
MHIAKAGEVVWYATGRFYATENDTPSKLLDVGYFLHLQGIPRLFQVGMSERDALLTFAAAPFTAPAIDNGGLSIGVDMRGAFSIYLRERAGATFDDPATFFEGQCIGTFERIAIVPTVKVGVSATETLLANVFTAKLLSSSPFVFEGAEHDLRDLIGEGITQWGTAATTTLVPPAGYSAVVPFLGSAVRVG